MGQQTISDRRNRPIHRKEIDLLDQMYVNREGQDIISKLRMRCCDRFIKWNGTGMKGLLKATNTCPVCSARLDTRQHGEINA